MKKTIWIRKSLMILMEFENDSGTLSIQLQGLSDFHFSAVEFNNLDLVIELNLQGQRLVFDGKLEDGKISSDFTQQDQIFPFELTPSTANETVDEEDFIEIAGGTMKAEVEMSEGEGPFSAMLILAGSVSTDRDGNSLMLLGKNNSLKMVVKELAGMALPLSATISAVSG